MTFPGPAPPGWYPDPAGSGGWRWWDGAAWTQHLTTGAAVWVPAPSPLATGESVVDAERALVSPLRWLWIGWAASACCNALWAVVMAQWFREFIEVLDQPGSDPEAVFDPAFLALGGLTQLASMANMAFTVVFGMWIYRAVTVADALGRAGPRTPVLSGWSVIIPFLNLWWPYESVRELFPTGDARRGRVALWWASFLIASLGMLVVLFASVISPWIGALCAVAAGVAAVWGALVGRWIASEMLAEHEEAVATASSTSPHRPPW